MRSKIQYLGQPFLSVRRTCSNELKFSEIGADVLVPKFTRAEVRLPDGRTTLNV